MPARRRDPARRLAAALVLLWAPAPVACQKLHVDPGAHHQARFVSRTQLEEFDGVTDRIDGYVILDGQPLSPSTATRATQLYFEVDLASVDTGIALRNRHMRDRYLEVKEYPNASFKGRVTRVEQHADGVLHVTAAGIFSVHGVPRDLDIECDVSPDAGSYRTTCAFTVLLSDHGIAIPKIMFLRLANEVRVEVELTLSSPATGEGS